MSMEEWKEYSLSDIAKYSQGKQIPIQLQYEEKNDSLIRFIRIVDYTSNWNQPPRYVLQDSKYHIKSDDIVMIRYGTPGKVFRGHEGLIANNMFKISVNEDIIDKGYAFWYLSLEQVFKQLMSFQASTTMPAISFGMLRNIIMKVPSKTTQRKIAKILDTIDDKIEVNRRINDNLEQQAQALYKQWFVDFEFPNEEGNPYKSSGGKMVDSEQGTIPDEWGIGRLEDVGDIIGGGTPSKAVLDYYTKDGIAWITPKDLSITQTKFISKGEIDITELGYSNSSAKIMPRGSVLFSSRAPIGYISIAKNEVCTNQGFKSVVPHNGHTAFIYYFLLTNTSNIESQASGSTFKEASGALMKALNIVIPNDSILDAFEKIISPIFDAQENLEEENLKLATLRDSLLPKLMSGELSVDDVLVD